MSPPSETRRRVSPLIGLATTECAVRFFALHGGAESTAVFDRIRTFLAKNATDDELARLAGVTYSAVCSHAAAAHVDAAEWAKTWTPNRRRAIRRDQMTAARLAYSAATTRHVSTVTAGTITRRPERRSTRAASRHTRQRRTATSRDDGEGGEPGEPPADRPRRDVGRPRSRPIAVERHPRVTGGDLVPVCDLLPRVLAGLIERMERARHACLWRRRASRSGGLRPRLAAKSGLPAVTA